MLELSEKTFLAKGKMRAVHRVVSDKNLLVKVNFPFSTPKRRLTEKR